MTTTAPASLHGRNIIGYETSAEGAETYTANDPATNRPLPTAFYNAMPAEIDRAMERAESAFDLFRRLSPEERATFLDAISDEIEGLGDRLIERAHAETALPIARLTGERTRTLNQTRLYARVAREGSWVDARIDTALPDRKPAPRPDLRRMLIPIGPIVVFGASNLPLAISVVSCDTLAAFAVGCSVVVKSHPSHPGTSEMMAGAIVQAALRTGMPDGVFSMLHGTSKEVGLRLVRHPLTQAAAFTGSEQAGRALFDAAAARPDPIPVYAEMGSTNPVFVLPGALAERGARIAEGFVQSMTLGVGQFCTQPGILLGLEGEALNRLIQTTTEISATVPGATMLNAPICRAFHEKLQIWKQVEGVHAANKAQENDAVNNSAAAAVFTTDAATFLANPLLAHEVFGPSSLIVACTSVEVMEQIARELKGQLTATLHGTPEDLTRYSNLVRILERKAGRLIFNGFPTGVEVCAAIHHGGPYPATTFSQYTSMGTAALQRFVRPVCYQDFPDEALPPPLRNLNEGKLWRLINDQFTQADLE